MSNSSILYSWSSSNKNVLYYVEYEWWYWCWSIISSIDNINIHIYNSFDNNMDTNLSFCIINKKQYIFKKFNIIIDNANGIIINSNNNNDNQFDYIIFNRRWWYSFINDNLVIVIDVITMFCNNIYLHFNIKIISIYYYENINSFFYL